MPENETAPAGETTTETTTTEEKAFEAIQSQEDLDRIIQKRIERERARFSDYDDKAAKAAKYDEIEESNRTEDEKRAAELKTTATERDEARRDAALARAALKHGLSEDDLELIGAGEPEEIESRAGKLAARLAGQKTGPTSTALGRVNGAAASGTPEQIFEGFLQEQLGR